MTFIYTKCTVKVNTQLFIHFSLFFVFSFSTYLPKRTLMQCLKIMQTTRNQEETQTASQSLGFFYTFLLSCCISWHMITTDLTRVFSSTTQGVCCERGGCWRPGIFQCHAGDAASLQIWEAAVCRHPGQPPRYIHVSDLWRASPTQTLW